MKFEYAAAAVALSMLAGAATAATVNTKADVVFIVDESGSMGGEQAFLENVVIDKLDADLATAGVTDRKYGLVGYGGPSSGVPRLFGGGFMNAADTKTELGNLVTSGGFEDGYEAIKFALDTYSFTSGAAVNFILVTDEDRDVRSGSTNDFTSIFNELDSKNILLNAIVDNPFTSDNASSSEVIGIDESLSAYTTDGVGGFNTDTGGVVGNGFGSTETDYVQLALDTGGAAWNLNLLRAGGMTAASFGEAFIDIKVAEITTQPPTSDVPLPAAGWMLISGVAALGAFGARKRRKA